MYEDSSDKQAGFRFPSFYVPISFFCIPYVNES